MRPVLAFAGMIALFLAGTARSEPRWPVPAEADALFARGDGEAAFAMTLPLLLECERAEPSGEACFDLYLAVSEFSLRAASRLSEGEEVARRGLVRAERLSTNSAASAGMKNNLAQTLDHQKRYDEAEPLYREAVATYTRLRGADDAFTRTAKVNLARNLRSQLSVSNDPRAYEALIELEVSKSEGDLASLVDLGQGLANALALSGRYKEAEPFARESLALSIEISGEDSIETARASELLATIVGSLERFEEAETLFVRALVAYRTATPEDHRSIGSALQQLAITAKDQSDLVRSEELLREALSEIETALASSGSGASVSPTDSAEYLYAKILDSLGSVMQDQYRYDEAERFYRAAVDQTARVLGENDYYVAFRLNNLGSLLSARRKYAEAKEALGRALALCLVALSAEHGDCATIEMNFAATLKELNETSEAEQRFRHVVEVRRTVLGEESLAYQIAAANLAGLLAKTGELDEARTIYMQTAATADARFPVDLSERIKVLWFTGDFLRKNDPGAAALARTLFGKAVDGVLLRMAASDFGTQAQSDLRSHGDLFVSQVKNAWVLMPETEPAQIVTKR